MGVAIWVLVCLWHIDSKNHRVYNDVNNSEEKVMKRLMYILPILATLVCVSTSCEEISYDTTGSITGKVYDVHTGMPIKDALVSLSPSAHTCLTGLDGCFGFKDLKLQDNQQYLLQVQKDGYETNNKPVTLILGRTIEVNIPLRKEN